MADEFDFKIASLTFYFTYFTEGFQFNV